MVCLDPDSPHEDVYTIVINIATDDLCIKTHKKDIKGTKFTIRMWLSHVICIAGETSTKKFCIYVCTSFLRGKKLDVTRKYTCNKSDSII